jgi:ribosome maturation factor RimP
MRVGETKTGNPQGVAAKTRYIAAPIAAAMGLRLWDVRFMKEGADWYLRLWIDKDGGVGLDDCEAFSRALDKPLDEADFVEQFYFLEVCSPGIARELTRDEHFAACLGSTVDVRLVRPLPDGRRMLSGTLTAFAGRELTLTQGEETHVFALKDTASVKLTESIPARGADDVFPLHKERSEDE